MRRGVFVYRYMQGENAFEGKSSQIVNMRLAGFCYLCRELD